MLGGAPHAVTSLLAALLADTVVKVTQTEGTPPHNVVLSHQPTGARTAGSCSRRSRSSPTSRRYG